ncbi:putative 1,4-alpha-glucan branching enzyme [Helianthus annuus]|uniref:1,4-alpha-glucan branching enzyme n=1 Tax=Helianthus annuus TaxID=4232 RepID=A0A9K3NBK3_HELAN|nr:putative 1,4-alpha-glucan branching enzyme [Helianthus annuus]KAJ0900714.1 putative 1,4-alpha-glucan branching enzyme [Helianthus annuus]
MQFMNEFDRAMNLLDDKFSFLASTKQIVSSADEEDKVIVFERGDLVFVFNFHPDNTYDGYKVGCDLPGKYRVALDSDAWEFGGHGRVGHDVDHFTSPEGLPGVPETNFNNRPNSFKVLSPPRTCVVYYRVEEEDILVESGVEEEILVETMKIHEVTPATEGKAQSSEIPEEEDDEDERLI